MQKPSVARTTLKEMLRQRWGDLSDLHPLSQGLVSQAFGFRADNSDLVIRINLRKEGFEKDNLVSRMFAGTALKVPEVLEIGRLDAEHAYCITRRAPGILVHDLETEALTELVVPIRETLTAIAGADLRATAGFGYFDGQGVAPHATWWDYLMAVSDPERFEGNTSLQNTDIRVIREAGREVDLLAVHCPEVRCLIHGDFGCYNLLSEDGHITGVIDWDLALFGDPLYDVANLCFWQEAAMERTTRHMEAKCSSLPQGRARLRCYQLRIGLQELAMTLSGAGPGDMAWLMNRCKALLAEGK